MLRKKNSLKAIALSLGLAALLLPANTLNAQSRPGDLFGSEPQANGNSPKGLFGSEPQANGNSPKGLMEQNRSGETLEISDSGITNGNFGEQPTPLGSGLVLLIGAGLGYVAFKKKEDKQ